MSKYRVGDVVIADYSYFNKFHRYITQSRLWVITKFDEELDLYFVSYVTKRLYQANSHDGITVLKTSLDGIKMSLKHDSFIYCDEKVDFEEDDIDRRIGGCLNINDILKKLKINCPLYFF